MFFENELPMNHEPSLDYIAKAWATYDVEGGETLNFDHAYEMSRSALESELEFEGLKMTTSAALKKPSLWYGLMSVS